jgi:paraquat-inducible protein B
MKDRETVVETIAWCSGKSVRGLAVGAAVDFRGVTVGEVRRIELEYDPQAVSFVTAVTSISWPERMRPRNRQTQELGKLTPNQRLERFVAHGFRGQLRSANLLTGQLFVALDFFPKAPQASSTPKRRRRRSRRCRARSRSSRNRSATS